MEDQDMLTAVMQDRAEIAKAVVDAGANLNAPWRENDKKWPLQLAVQKGALNVVRYLLEAGADVEAKDSEFALTPLMLAASRGQAEIVRLLINAGANVHAETRFRRPVMEFAAEAEVAEGGDIVRALIAAGIDVKSHPKDLLPLLNVAVNAHPETLKALLEAGCDPNFYNDDHPSAVHFAVIRAAESWKPENLQALLDAGGDPNLRLPKDHKDDRAAGMTPMELAKKRRARGASKLFKEALKKK